MKTKYAILSCGLSVWPLPGIFFAVMLVVRDKIAPYVHFDYDLWMCIIGLTFSSLGLADKILLNTMAEKKGTLKPKVPKNVEGQAETRVHRLRSLWISLPDN